MQEQILLVQKLHTATINVLSPFPTKQLHSQQVFIGKVTVRKYQLVKKFHVLARIGVIVKLWLSVLSNLKSYIII